MFDDPYPDRERRHHPDPAHQPILPIAIRVTVVPDAPVTPDWSALWRKLLSPPTSAASSADALGDAEPVPTASPPQDVERGRAL